MRVHGRFVTTVGALAVAAALTSAGTAAAGSITHPSAPRSVHATARNAAALVQWARPASLGGAPILRYVVTSHPGGRSCVTRATKCVVARLANGTTYSFSVIARNRVGASPRSALSNRVTPRAATPASTRKLVVTPSTNLVKGQRVTVTGSGFTPHDQVYLVECQVKATGQNGCDVATATPVTISATGVLPATAFSVVTGTVGSGTCGTKTTNLKACAISAGNATGGDSAVAPIAFKAP
jgi:hypothetical protein